MKHALIVLAVVFLALPSRSQIPQGGWGEAHNNYVTCLEQVFLGKSRSIIDVLDALVQHCHYCVPDYAEYMTNYSLLAESTLSSLEAGGLSAVVAPYKRRLGPLHQNFLVRLETILHDSPDYNLAFRQIEALYQEAIQHLCTQAKSDIATLAALDIAASSTLYWGPRDTGDSPTPLKAKWWQVVAADVAGGVVGGLFGGGVGAVGLGSACSGYVASL